MSEPTRFGPYLVYELLGTGGMATVHRAESQSAGGFRKRVALKRLLSRLSDDPEIVQSFTKEARLASHLHHHNIAQTYDVGVVDGQYYIAMELVPGPNLRQILRQCQAAAGAIPIEHALDVLVQVCEALEYAHQLADETGRPLGLVHRDVSPANVIVSGSGVVKLIDFGLAKVNRGQGTQAGILKGKLGYMAPEYTLGVLDARADLFALGVIAHELLTGKRLFDRPNDFEILQALREMPIQPPSRWNPDVLHELDVIVMTALERNPANRWQSAGAFRAALESFARSQMYGLTHVALGQWVEWAFSKEPSSTSRYEESVLSRVLGSLSEPSEPSYEQLSDSALLEVPTPPTAVQPFSDEAPTVARTDLAAPTKAGRARAVKPTHRTRKGKPAMPAAPRSARRAVLLFVLLVVMAGAAWYTGLLRLPLR